MLTTIKSHSALPAEQADLTLIENVKKDAAILKKNDFHPTAYEFSYC